MRNISVVRMENISQNDALFLTQYSQYDSVYWLQKNEGRIIISD